MKGNVWAVATVENVVGYAREITIGVPSILSVHYRGLPPTVDPHAYYAARRYIILGGPYESREEGDKNNNEHSRRALEIGPKLTRSVSN